jgi:membrane protein
MASNVLVTWRKMHRYKWLLPDLAVKVWKRVWEHDVLGRAAQLAYLFLLSLFPFVLFFTALMGTFVESNADLRTRLLDYFGAFAPMETRSLFNRTVDEISAASGAGKVVLGFLTGIWIASFGTGAIQEGLRLAHGVRETRPWWKTILGTLLLTVVFVVLGAFTMGVMLYGRLIGGLLAANLGLDTAFHLAWRVLQWPLLLVLAFAFSVLNYRFALDLHAPHGRRVVPGSLVAVGLWLAASFGLRLYLFLVPSYSRVYGSLGAVIALLLWLYLTGAAILIGGEVNAECERAAGARRLANSLPPELRRGVSGRTPAGRAR